MRSIRRTLRGPSALPKTQRNRALLYRTCFTTIGGSEIRISQKIYAGVDFFSGVQYIISVKDSKDNMLGSAHEFKDMNSGIVVPVFYKHHAMKAYWGSVGIARRIINLGTRWR
jgi:hypothetical protein